MNRREMAFCTAYVIHRNARRAAIEAGYTEGTANNTGTQILNRPHVQAQIQSMIKDVAEHVALDAAAIINELGAVALARPDEYMEEKGRVDLGGLTVWSGKRPDELTDRQKAAVKEIHTRNVYVGKGAKRRVVGQEFRYTLHDKMSALQMLGKHFDVFGEREPKDDLARTFADMPQEELEKLNQQFQQLQKQARDKKADEEAIDGEVLSHD